MILPLRNRHRIMLTAIALVLPVAFALGLSSRKPLPASPFHPGSAAAQQLIKKSLTVAPK
jgi:hypothetical protein